MGAFAENLFDMNKFLKKLLLFAAVVVLAAVSCTKGSAPGSNLDVPDPEGTLVVNRRNFKVDSENSHARLIATYKNPNGLYEPSAITVEPYVPGELDGNNAVFDLTIGTYTVRAEKLSVTVTVSM